METPFCPECGTYMKRKEGTTKKGWHYNFWSCAKWPACNGKIDINWKTATPVVKNLVDYNTVTFNTCQSEFLKVVRETNNNVKLDAGPGTGKTFTALSAPFFLSKDLKVVFLSFDNKTTKRNAEKAPDGVKTVTINACGRGNIARFFGKAFADNAFKKDHKVKDIFVKYLESHYVKGEDAYKEFSNNIYTMCKVVSLLKSMMLIPEEGFDLVVERDNATFTLDTKFVYERVEEAYCESISDQTCYDFDDQVLWCVLGIVPVEQYDLVIVDESQDLTEVNKEFLKLLVKEGGRIIIVGDQNQSIYFFRGVSLTVMETLGEAFDCVSLPLNITRRLPKSGVRLCNELFPEIELYADESAIEGSTNDINRNQFENIIKEGDVVLCRNNAPLVAPAFALIKAGKKAVILGRDIGRDLVNLIDRIIWKYKCEDDYGAFLESLEDYRAKELEKIARTKGNPDKTNDSIDCILALTEGNDDVAGIVQSINTIFSDDQVGVIFSSVHKFKGDEANNIFLIEPQLFNSSKAVGEDQKKSERNIMWVAYTRQKENLYIVASDKRR